MGSNPFWFDRLLDDTTYQNQLKCRWEYLRDRSFHQDSLFNFIDSMALYLDDAQQRNFQKWPTLGTYVWPNYYVGNTYQDELNFFKTWIGDRLAWIDNNLGGNCYEILGCTDPFACNYDPLANTNDGSCNYNSASYDTLVSSISISWNGLNLFSSGDYSYTLLNSSGCDSVANINFTISITGTHDIASSSRRVLIKVTDVLGRETKGTKNEPLFYIYDDGTVEKRVIIQ